MTIADMNRLEQAARISMGEFQDAEDAASPLPPAAHISLPLVALGLIAAVFALAVFHLAF